MSPLTYKTIRRYVDTKYFPGVNKIEVDIWRTDQNNYNNIQVGIEDIDFFVGIRFTSCMLTNDVFINDISNRRILFKDSGDRILAINTISYSELQIKKI